MENNHNYLDPIRFVEMELNWKKDLLEKTPKRDERYKVFCFDENLYRKLRRKYFRDTIKKDEKRINELLSIYNKYDYCDVISYFIMKRINLLEANIIKNKKSIKFYKNLEIDEKESKEKKEKVYIKNKKNIDIGELKNNNPIINILSTYGIEVSIKGWFKVRNEKTPSCHLYKDRLGNEKWHDFGDGSHGDVIDLIMKIEGINTSEAIKKLS